MNIFVGNLPATATSEDLRQLFNGYGTIINIVILRDTDSGQPLSHGHVYLVPEQAAHEAITHLRSAILKGNRLIVRECIYRSRPERRVKNSPWRGDERRMTNTRRHKGYSLTQPDSLPQNQN
jgi:RNA recognition motif-containing protein